MSGGSWICECRANNRRPRGASGFVLVAKGGSITRDFKLTENAHSVDVTSLERIVSNRPLLLGNGRVARELDRTNGESVSFRLVRILPK